MSYSNTKINLIGINILIIAITYFIQYIAMEHGDWFYNEKNKKSYKEEEINNENKIAKSNTTDYTYVCLNRSYVYEGSNRD